MSWFALKERLLTKDHLRFMEIDRTYRFCTSSETIKHRFFDCAFSQRVWEELHAWLGIAHLSSTILSAIKWIKKDKRATVVLTKARWMALTCTIHIIWNSRNVANFEGMRCQPSDVIHRVKTQVYGILYSLFPANLMCL
ncbi:hypothetical protein C2S51_015844 [Perilla frutescens var. frutescens]|nr:hypothetical protein C2S51_015844 [Perilla frutescens var. frutescens]